ncbi:DUF2909 domain-containing protein [Gynuella sp.]|uniref:DUF2909 domain-containing protein n=1 Tax=Gynuella sp. TaxID=2969146 RepID=UPI003D106A6C
MWLKILIIFLIVLMLFSLSGALYTLFRFPNDSKTMVYLLTVRICLAVLIVCLLMFGYFSGQLNMAAPWSGHY